MSYCYKLSILGLPILKNQLLKLEEFNLKNRFINQLPDDCLQQLQPLDAGASKLLWDYILRINLHADTPFQKGFFKKITKIEVTDFNNLEIRKWLSKKEILFTKNVYLSYTPNEALIIPWGILAKYYDIFYKKGIDDLTVLDETQNWAALFYHDSEIYFGSK